MVQGIVYKIYKFHMCIKKVYVSSINCYKSDGAFINDSIFYLLKRDDYKSAKFIYLFLK